MPSCSLTCQPQENFLSALPPAVSINKDPIIMIFEYACCICVAGEKGKVKFSHFLSLFLLPYKKVLRTNLGEVDVKCYVKYVWC